MRIEGEVGLEAMVWLSESPDAALARSLSASVAGSEWTLAMIEPQRVRWRAHTVELEGRTGTEWAGLVIGRVHEIDSPGPTNTTLFRPYIIDPPAPPMRLISCWLAIDLDGNVACFDRDQLGAAPMKRCWGPRPEPRLEPYGVEQLVNALSGHHAHAHMAARTFTFSGDRARLANAFRKHAPESAGRRWYLSLTDKRLVASTSIGPNEDDPIPPSLIQWLHTNDLCEGCARSPMRDPRTEGLFAYMHQGRSRAAPYDRVAEPTKPWSLEHAAKTLSVSIEALRRSVLPVLFATKNRLQPVEYVQCTWSETVPWESESGERHGPRRLA